MIQFQKNLIIKGEILIDTGLRIGGNSDNISIGGIENIVIRDPISDLPIIPGSSLKGKIRSLLELSIPEVSNYITRLDRKNIDRHDPGDPCTCGKCVVCILFGTSSKETYHGPTRIKFRDSFPTKSTIDEWEKMNDVIQGTEVKSENTINRITSDANPRQQERIPKGSRFNFKIIFSIYSDEDYNIFKTLFTGMKELEDNYLGSNGSRGYGEIKFENVQITKRTKEYYQGLSEEEIFTKTQTDNKFTELDIFLKDKDLVSKLKK